MKVSLRVFWGLVNLVAAWLVISSSTVSAQTQQEHIHQMAHSVMPFEMASTLHIFEMTETGGVLQVIARDADEKEQIALIQQHLMHEAEKFGHGDYSDPATLHGKNMPGLDDLQAGASGIKVSYENLPNGGEITFITKDLHLLTAIHRWFGAQLSEHGADARPK